MGVEHQAINLPRADGWSFVAGSIGRGSILLGAALFALAVIFFAVGSERRAWAMKAATGALIGGALSILTAFISLATLFANDQFHFDYVRTHSEKINTIAYKIAAIWSGQEGSFLLWATTSTLFLLLTWRGVGPYKRWFGLTAALFLGAICGILAYETPFAFSMFEGVAYKIPDGNGLAPTLNNYWVIIHPPTIFMGFGSLLIPFCYAMSALATRNYEDWIPRVRPWALVSVAIVGLGLCMGGFWAYETLGWGGFWKWDPVENVSFVPWVLIAAFIHGVIVQVVRKKWHFSNIALGAAPFLAFTYGTFLTRAGFLDKVSVHSFAQMDASAHKVLLWFLVLAVGAFTVLYAFRYRQDHAKLQPLPLDGVRRDTFYRIGMILLVMLGLATGIGMSVPLIQFVMNKSPKVVEEHLYHIVLVWFFVPILLLMAITPFISWRHTKLRDNDRLFNIFVASLFLTGVALLVGSNPSVGVQMPKGAMIDFPFGIKVSLGVWMMVLIGLCIFTIVANLWRLIALVRKSPMAIGPFLSHIGVATAMAGLIVSRGFEREQTYVLQPGYDAVALQDGGLKHSIKLIKDQKFDFFDRSNKVALSMDGDGEPFTAQPGLYYTVNGQTGEPSPVTWPFIQRWFTHDVYVVLHPLTPEASEEINLKVGQTVDMVGRVWHAGVNNRYTVTYEKMERQGEAGMAGTKFGARLKVTGPEGTKSILPQMVLGKGGGPEKQPAAIDSEFSVQMTRLDAKDSSVTLQLNYVVPIFPIDTYYKPMTVLVWGGVGILTLGGLLSAWTRRRRKTPPPAEGEQDVARDAPPVNDDALITVS